MPQLLVSVTSVKEAQIALQCGVDIIDLKDPDQGALGALPLALITEIVTFVNIKSESERKLTSATIGDLPMEPELILEHVLALSKTNVDIIKIGFFSDPNVKPTYYQPCLEVLKAVAESGVKLIAVLFSEYEYPASLMTAIKNAGFYGVMFDTAVKNGATFLNYHSLDEMKEIANNVQAQGLIFGLAGSLNLQHVTMVKAIAPDYIGFRGGVCINNLRRSALDAGKIIAIRELV
jgi:uncharacterized protein (UPF0264 family)